MSCSRLPDMCVHLCAHILHRSSRNHPHWGHQRSCTAKGGLQFQMHDHLLLAGPLHQKLWRHRRVVTRLQLPRCFLQDLLCWPLLIHQQLGDSPYLLPGSLLSLFVVELQMCSLHRVLSTWQPEKLHRAIKRQCHGSTTWTVWHSCCGPFWSTTFFYGSAAAFWSWFEPSESRENERNRNYARFYTSPPVENCENDSR